MLSLSLFNNILIVECFYCYFVFRVTLCKMVGHRNIMDGARKQAGSCVDELEPRIQLHARPFYAGLFVNKPQLRSKQKAFK